MSRVSQFHAAKRKLRQKVMGTLALVAMVGFAGVAYSMATDDNEVTMMGRQLASELDASKCEQYTDKVLILPYALIMLYMFIAMAIICDDYFEPVLSTISEKLHLSEDVAGATFMAAGSSAPELLTSVSGTLIQESSVGIATIVGSAMFNVLVIVALSSAVVKGTIPLDWRPLVRDASFYIGSIVMLYIVLTNDELERVIYRKGMEAMDFDRQSEEYALNFTTDSEILVFGQVTAIEGAILVVSYVGYIVFMYFNRRIFGLCPKDNGKGTDNPSFSGDSDSDEVKEQTDDEVFHVPREKRHSIKRAIASFDDGSDSEDDHKHDDVFSVPREKRHSIKRAIASFDETQVDDDGEEPAKAADTAIVASSMLDLEAQSRRDSDASSDHNSEYESPFAFPENMLGRVWFVLTFPINVAYYFTIPNTEVERWENWYLFSFFMNIAWIAGECYIAVDMAERLGCLLEIDTTVMGIVFLAGGTSVPDAIASMIVARQGYADMAIANALGSNVFDILLALGVPWLLYNLIKGKNSLVDNEGIVVNVMILGGTVILFLLVIAVNRCKMNNKIGIAFVVLYAIYVTYALLSAKCKLGALNPEACPIA